MTTDKRKIRLKVASPCNARWEDMRGDDAVRFCGQCKKNVYQLSNMTTAAIEELLSRPDGVCARFYQRADGTVLTADCPVGGARRRRKRLAISAGAGLMSALAAAMLPGAVQPTMGDVSVAAPMPVVDGRPVAREPAMEPPAPAVQGDVDIVELGQVAPVEIDEVDGQVDGALPVKPLMGKIATPRTVHAEPPVVRTMGRVVFRAVEK